MQTNVTMQAFGSQGPVRRGMNSYIRHSAAYWSSQSSGVTDEKKKRNFPVGGEETGKREFKGIGEIREVDGELVWD